MTLSLTSSPHRGHLLTLELHAPHTHLCWHGISVTSDWEAPQSPHGSPTPLRALLSWPSLLPSGLDTPIARRTPSASLLLARFTMCLLQKENEHTHTHTHTRTHTHTHTHTRTHARTHARTRTHAHTHARTHTHTHSHTHTRTHPLSDFEIEQEATCMRLQK